MSNMNMGVTELRGELEEVVNLLALCVDITAAGVNLSERSRAALVEAGYSRVERGASAVSKLGQEHRLS